MLWGAFSYQGGVNLVICTENLNSEIYIQILEHHLLPNAEEMHDGDYIFQQDNAAAHTSNETKEFFFNEAIHVMDWPSRSPDLNPMENVWAHLVLDVYANFVEYECIDDLIDAVTKAWDNLSLAYCQTLVNGMPRRIVKLHDAGGKKIKY